MCRNWYGTRSRAKEGITTSKRVVSCVLRVVVEGQGRRSSGGVGRVHGSALSGRRSRLEPD